MRELIVFFGGKPDYGRETGLFAIFRWISAARSGGMSENQ